MANGNEDFSTQDQLAAEAEELERRLGGRMARLEQLGTEGFATTDTPRDLFCEAVWPVLRPVLDLVLKSPGVPENIKEMIRKMIPLLAAFCQRAGGGT